MTGAMAVRQLPGPAGGTTIKADKRQDILIITQLGRFWGGGVALMLNGNNEVGNWQVLAVRKVQLGAR